MSKDEEFVVVTDAQSVERMLTNAEIDYEVYVEEGFIDHIEIHTGMRFYFDSNGNLNGLQPFLV